MHTEPTAPSASAAAPTQVGAGPVPWASTHLHVVTGKGGVGKTTVAGALALALARGGARVLLTEVEGRGGFAELFDREPRAHREELLAVTADGGEVHGLEVEAEAALLEYLESFYHLGGPARALRRIGAVEFATNIAPGLRDVLLLGKVYEATRRRDPDGRRHYDAVVLDAPPTGRITRFLSVDREIADLARVGPVHRQAESIAALTRSERTRVHVVTLLEELPVQETLDAVAELHDAGFRPGAVFVNGVESIDDADATPLPGPDDRPGDDEIARSLARALPDEAPDRVGGLATALVGEARSAARHRRTAAALRARLAGLGTPLVDVPAEPDPTLDPVDLLDELADALGAAGVTTAADASPGDPAAPENGGRR